VKINTKHKPKD